MKKNEYRNTLHPIYSYNDEGSIVRRTLSNYFASRITWAKSVQPPLPLATAVDLFEQLIGFALGAFSCCQWDSLGTHLAAVLVFLFFGRTSLDVSNTVTSACYLRKQILHACHRGLFMNRVVVVCVVIWSKVIRFYRKYVMVLEVIPTYSKRGVPWLAILPSFNQFVVELEYNPLTLWRPETTALEKFCRVSITFSITLFVPLFISSFDSLLTCFADRWSSLERSWK